MTLLRASTHTLFCVALGFFLSACAESTSQQKTLSYADNAKLNYEKGLKELKDENFPEAIKYFAHVKNKYPFSRYATMSELKIADTFFQEEKFSEAADAYRFFIKFHPTHPQVTDGYASYRVCQSFVKQLPGDWFLIPPSHEKDQALVKQTAVELSAFLRVYPETKYVKEIEKLYRECLRRLIAHEMYVAKFYLDRDKPKGTIYRLEGVIREYPDAAVLPEVMLLLGRTYLETKEAQKAKQTLSSLIEKYPRDRHSRQARDLLKSLGVSTKPL